MNPRITCPRCQKSLTVSAKLAGRAGECPHCACRFRIPAEVANPQTPPAKRPMAAAQPQPAPPPPPVDAPWMYMFEGKIAGPVSQMQLAQLHQMGYIPVDGAVFHVPSGRWTRLNLIPGMFMPAYQPAYAPPSYAQSAYAAPAMESGEIETFPRLR